MSGLALLMFLILAVIAKDGYALRLTGLSRPSSFIGIGDAISDALHLNVQPYCSNIIFSHGLQYYFLGSILKDLGKKDQLTGIFQANRKVHSLHNESTTESKLKELLSKARDIRRHSKCFVAVIISDDIQFLSEFAEVSLRVRLFVWASRLLVVTRQSFSSLRSLMVSHWTFSMMNAAILNLEGQSPQLYGRIYVNLPYSPDGTQVMQVASWSQRKGLKIQIGNYLHPEKYSNFFGAIVNVTARTFDPYWLETTEEHPDGSATKTFGGTDYHLLSTIAESLNFTINVLESSSWDEVAKRVEERISFMATVYHNVLPQRLERYDYSYTYEYGLLSFCVAKPGLKPQWQSLYYPLPDSIWLAILATLVVVSLVLYLMNKKTYQAELIKCSSSNIVMETVFGTLLGQPLLKHLPGKSTFRIALGTWLIFAFIMGTAYRGNLTASLTLPKYPPRVETIEQLVETFDRITMSPYGNEFIRFFKQSDNRLYRTMAEQMAIVPSVTDGLREAIEDGEAHVAGRRYMEQTIAKHFSNPDGSTKLYVGRESVLPGISAWPIPHDAPYKPQIDRLMMSVVEGGLYELWSRNILRRTREESRKRAREYREKRGSIPSTENYVKETAEDSQTFRRSQVLTIVHMQGPLMLLLLGLASGGVMFSLEIISNQFFSKERA